MSRHNEVKKQKEFDKKKKLTKIKLETVKVRLSPSKKIALVASMKTL